MLYIRGILFMLCANIFTRETKLFIISIMKQELLNKISNKEIIVGVVGLGYVGLPLAVEKAKAGFKTIGFDIQSQRLIW